MLDLDNDSSRGGEGLEGCGLRELPQAGPQGTEAFWLQTGRVLWMTMNFCMP